MLPSPTQWFFIAGCQRSGTTLLRLILECHSQIFCFDEARSYSVLAAPSAAAMDSAKRLVGFKIPRLTEQLGEGDCYDYGLPARPWRFYAGQPVLFMVRDPRDTIASMLKLRGNRSWLEDWAVPIIEHKCERDPSFAERWREELRVCRSSGSLAAFGALYWAYKNEAILRYVDRGYPVLPVGYESLVRSPQYELRRACAHLGVSFESGLLNHEQREHDELDGNGMAIGNTDPTRSVDGASIGQWKQWLRASDEAIIKQIAGHVERKMRERFGALRVPHPTPGQIAS